MTELISLYPYVSLYRVLLAKKNQSGNGDEYRHALHQAALHAPDRVRLYELLHIPEVAEPADSPVKSKSKKKKPAKKGKKSIEKAVKEAAAGKDPVPGHTAPLSAESEEVVTKATAPEASRPDVGGEADEPPALKDTLMRSAAERNISMDEKHTFLEWLDILEHPPVTDIAEEHTVLEKQFRGQHAASSYEASLQKEAGDLEPEEKEETDSEGYQKVSSLAERSLQAGAALATETLAKIMLKQGKIKDAIAVYEQLRLKYPEKSDYFAALISDLKAR